MKKPIQKYVPNYADMGRFHGNICSRAEDESNVSIQCKYVPNYADMGRFLGNVCSRAKDESNIPICVESPEWGFP